MINLQTLPSIEQILQTPAAGELVAEYGRSLTLDAVRSTLNDVRLHLKSNPHSTAPEKEILIAKTRERLSIWREPILEQVINATGVILHTNLGRAPLSKAAIAAMVQVSLGYSNLEFDLGSGKRGSRFMQVESVLQKLTGAESSLIVNNNASAVLVILAALASRKRVIIARSQLVEIGGGFRVPDVMKLSGAKLIECGTTNKVRLADYEEALQESSALIMRVHRSNFKMIGFTEEPELKELVDLAHQYHAWFVDDLGSGSLVDTVKYGIEHEPMVQESIAAGADVVCFSGDKLLGGPQAGLIAGSQILIARIKKHPLARAVRADKTILAGTSATLLHYLKDEAEREIPILKMIAMPANDVKTRIENWVRILGHGSVSACESTVGGGSLPGQLIPSFALELSVKSADKFLKILREQAIPIIARTVDNKILIDARTILNDQEESLLSELKIALTSETNEI